MTTNMPKLSSRAHTALDVLADGGSFRYGLERNSYTGREQFQWRLKSHGGSTIKGIGGAAYNELVKNGFTFRREARGFTGSACYYYLSAGA
jgi:hypothetical protein